MSQQQIWPTELAGDTGGPNHNVSVVPLINIIDQFAGKTILEFTIFNFC
jgi:hypothetical protein